MCASDFYGKLWCEGMMLLLQLQYTKKDVFSSFGSTPDVFFGSVMREVSGPCSAATEYVISIQVIQNISAVSDSELL